MVKPIIQYPTVPSLEFGANVRFFDDSLKELVQDLKDTIEANNLTALAGFQIGSPLSIFVIKQDSDFLTIINPVIIKREGFLEPTESTVYFPNLTAKTKRYNNIKLSYEDIEGKQHFMEADGDLSVTIQRKIDYTLGSNFRVRMSKEEQKTFDAKLEFGTNAIDKNDCPTVFKRDRILETMRYSFILGILGIIISFFTSEETTQTIKMGEYYIMGFIFLLAIIYFFYAQYEGKQYKHCTSCQIGNIIGTTVIELFKLLVLVIATYFLI